MPLAPSLNILLAPTGATYETMYHNAAVTTGQQPLLTASLSPTPQYHNGQLKKRTNKCIKSKQQL